MPSELCLLGCVFLLAEWEGMVESRGDLMEIKLAILEKGGEVEQQYGQRLTHVMAESLRHPILSQVRVYFCCDGGMCEGKRKKIYQSLSSSSERWLPPLE